MFVFDVVSAFLFSSLQYLRTEYSSFLGYDAV
jgi:hypothetical protein